MADKFLTDASAASHIERQFWLLDSQGLGSAYNIISAFQGRSVNFDRFQNVVMWLIQKYPLFASQYHFHDGVLLRDFGQGQAFETCLRQFDSGSDVFGWFSEQCRKPFELEGGPLIRLVFADYKHGNKQYFALVMHHILTDLKTKDLVGEFISTYYNSNNESFCSESQPVSLYNEFCQWQKQWLDSTDSEPAKSYWRKQLVDVSRGAAPAARRHNRPSAFGVVNLDFDDSLELAIDRFAKDRNSSPFIVLLAAYAATLSRYCLESDVVIGVPLTNRTQSDFKELAGCFVNTLPLVLATDNESFNSLVQITRKALLFAHRYQQVPTTVISSQIGRSAGENTSIYRHGYTFEHLMSLNLNGCEVEPLLINPSQPQLDLFLRCRYEKGRLTGQFEFNSGMYDAVFAERFVESFKLILRGSLMSPERPMSELSYLPAADAKIIAAANNTYTDFGPVKTLMQSFEEQAAVTPDALAIVAAEGSLTYRQFNQRTNQFARQLLEAGVQPGDVVGLLCPRSVAMMEGIYAILKSGAVYLPIDTELPDQRIDYMLKQADAKVLVIGDDDLRSRNLAVATTLSIDTIRARLGDFSAENLLRHASPSDRAYIIFTSGSTGLPKGVVNCHSGIFNRMQWMQQKFAYGPGHVVMQKTPYSFDVSLWEIFWPLQVGAAIAIARHNSHRDPYELLQQLDLYRVNLVHFVPAMLAAFLATGAAALNSLRAVVCSGEELSIEHQEKFYQQYPNATLYNLYGPTEAAVEVSYWQCPRNTIASLVPIGAPVPNTQLYVVDGDAHQVPVGLMGELWIGGVQVAAGYIGSEELTAERFINNPFAPGKVYRTGDYVRWTDDGVIEYLGRKDFQVKISGVRIELSEIENALLAYKGVALCVVTVEKSSAGSVGLRAYYSTVEGCGVIDKKLLAEHLAQVLPVYMRPAHFQWVETFQLSSSGKVDRKRLPPPVTEPLVRNVELTPVQREIASIWEDVLGAQGIGLDDGFFEVGGNSLLLMKVFAQLKDRFPGRLKSVDLFSHPTIRALSDFLSDSNVGRNINQGSRAEKIRKALSKNRGSNFSKEERHE